MNDVVGRLTPQFRGTRPIGATLLHPEVPPDAGDSAAYKPEGEGPSRIVHNEVEPQTHDKAQSVPNMIPATRREIRRIILP